MTNARSTKRALITSVMAMFLCFTMLLGTTFAWFTDTVTSGSNIIQSGTLDVDLVDEAGNSMAGEVIKFVTADDRAQNEILWEPGCTYETEPVYVKNNGNLALKYEIVINGIDGNAKLLEAIDWTVTVGNNTTTVDLADLKGELKATEKSGAIVLSGHMKEEAGNEYSGLTAGGISISVVATQLTYEKDSIDDQYDKLATVDTEAELKEALAADYDLITLGADFEVIDDIVIAADKKVTLNLNGHKLYQTDETDGGSCFIENKGTLSLIGGGTISYNYTGAPCGDTRAYQNNTINNSGNLTVDGVTIENVIANAWDGSHAMSLNFAINHTNGTLTVNKGSVESTYRSIRIAGYSGSPVAEFNGGNFVGQVWVQGLNNATTSLTVNGGSYQPVGGDGSSIYVDNTYGTNTVGITGGTFATKIGATNNIEKIIHGGVFTADAYAKTNSALFADGYIALENADGTWTIVKGVAVSTADELERALFWLDDGSVALVSGTINVTEPANQGNYGVMATMGVNLISANGGTIKDTTNSNSGIFVGGNITLIEGLTVESNSKKAFHIQGNKENLTLRDVTINNADDCAVYLQGATDIILENVTATAGGIADNAGSAQGVIFATKNLDSNQTASTVTIKSGTYTATEDGAAVVWSFYNSVVTIEGGTFTGLLKTADGGQIVIKGGTFSVNPSAYLATGYVAVENADGTWTVTAE